MHVLQNGRENIQLQLYMNYSPTPTLVHLLWLKGEVECSCGKFVYFWLECLT